MPGKTSSRNSSSSITRSANHQAELIVDHATDPALAEFLSLKKGKQVEVIVPQRGEKRQLLDLAQKNLEIAFFRDTLKVVELGTALHMARPPSVIECFDISHLSGTAMVGSMVQFPGREAGQEQLPAV